MEPNNRKEADELFHVGEEYLTVSCWKCRTKPEYLDAIPNLKRAAELYHGIKDYEKEKLVRNRLAFCFLNTKSFWEEGNEYDKIAQIEIKNLNAKEASINTITNCNKAFINAKDYAEAIRTTTKLGLLFVDEGEKDLAERVLELSFDDVLKYYHLITMDKDEPTEYIYKAVDLYLDLVFRRKDISNGITPTEKLCKILEEEEGDAKKLVHYYLVICLCYIITEEFTNFTFHLQKCKDLIREKMVEDSGNVGLIESIYNDYSTGKSNENTINKRMKDLSYDFSNELIKILREHLMGRATKEIVIVKEDVEVEIGNEKEGNKDSFIGGDGDSDYK